MTDFFRCISLANTVSDSPGATRCLLYICVSCLKNTAADIPVEEKTDSEGRWMSGWGRGRGGGQEWERERERERTRGDCETTAALVRWKKKSQTWSHRFKLSVQTKQRRGWGCIIPSRPLPQRIHHTPPLDYLSPDNACAADTPTPNSPALHQTLSLLRLSVFIASSIHLSFSPFSLATLKVRVGCT